MLFSSPGSAVDCLGDASPSPPAPAKGFSIRKGHGQRLLRACTSRASEVGDMGRGFSGTDFSFWSTSWRTARISEPTMLRITSTFRP